MPTLESDLTYLGCEIPKDVATQFKAKARAEDRSGQAQLRRLIRQFVLNGETPDSTPGLRKDAQGAAQHEPA
jgi:hypothetical protein